MISNKIEGLEVITSETCWLRLNDWIVPPAANRREDRGNNILHFNSKNRGYEDRPSAQEFVINKLKPQKALELESDSEILNFAVQEARKRNTEYDDGLYLEFGFCSGRTINFIGALAYDKDIYGFDSGKGLPIDWNRGPGFPKGTFAYKKGYNRMPFCPLDNVNLVMGEIESTLPLFKKNCLEKYNLTIDFIYIDSDLYETAKIIYDELGEYIRPEKTILVLDEGYNFSRKDEVNGHREWKDHEYKATAEFAQDETRKFNRKYLAYNKNHQQLVMTFTK